VRSRMGGPDQNRAYPSASVHRGPVSRAHGMVHRHRGRWIKDRRLNRVFSLKSP
jgi:hypothetical protein